MTRKLEELFELATDDDVSLTEQLPDQTAEVTKTALTNLEKIEAAIPEIKGLEEADGELDELAEMAKNSYRDLQDLAFQVEPRFSSEIFSAAGTMLGHAINAKTIKINKKLKQLDLLLKKEALEQKKLKEKEKDDELDNTPLGSGKELDRNELLKLLTEKNNQENK